MLKRLAKVDNKLDIIARTRGEVLGNKELTGENLFLAWGYPTAFFLLLEFLAMVLWDYDWTEWLWVGIPLVGMPLMVYFLHKDYQRTDRMTLKANVLLMMWIYLGGVCCAAGFITGITGVFRECFFAFFGLMCSLGCFVTGVILRFRPKTVCGLIATALSFLPLFFQGTLWPWQMLVTAVVVVVALIIPGHLFRRFVKDGSTCSNDVVMGSSRDDS